jgi:hypothetical protein
VIDLRLDRGVFDAMMAAPRLRTGAVALACAAILAGVAGCSTPTPSGTPEPAASVASHLDPALAALTDRIRAGLRQQGDFVTQLSNASVESPLPSGAHSVAIVALSMTNWAGGERQWLAANPPEACYAQAQDRYAEAVDAVAASATAFATLAQPSPGASGGDAQAAVAALVAARTTIQDADAQATAAVAGCATAP